jgi:uncharacterized membrane protein
VSRPAGWTAGDVIIGWALVVLLIALFLPWFSATARVGPIHAVTGNSDGPASHGYLWIVFVLAILGLVLIVTRELIHRVPANLPTPEQMLIGTTVLAFLLCLLGLVVRPTGLSGLLTVSVGWSYGGFIAVAAAAIALLAAAATSGPLQSAERRPSAWRTLRRPGSAI